VMSRTAKKGQGDKTQSWSAAIANLRPRWGNPGPTRISTELVDFPRRAAQPARQHQISNRRDPDRANNAKLRQ